jgi:Ca-activated chloride channel family protein
MSLLNPSALAGLPSLPVILLLHLLRNRRQQRAVASLTLWRGLQRQRHGSLPRSIPLSRMLLLQLLVASGITLALARPVFKYQPEQAVQTVVILDITTSMAAVDVPGDGIGGNLERRFDVARRLILSDLQGMDDADRMIVIGLDQDPRVLFSAEGTGKDQAAVALEALQPGATGIDLPAALTLANGLVDPERPNRILLLTDGAYTVDSSALPALDVPVTWEVLPSPDVARAVGNRAANQALLNVSARSLPNGGHRLFARIVNYSLATAQPTVQVTVDGRVLVEEVLTVEPEAEVARVWTLPAEGVRAAVEIPEPDALPLDNRAELFLARSTRRRITLVSETPEIVARALEAQPGVELTITAPDMPLPDPASYDLLVLDGLPLELTAWPPGDLLVIDPPLGHPLLPVRNYARNLHPDAAAASELLDGVDMSGVFFNRVPDVELPDWAQVDLRALPAQSTGVSTQVGQNAHPLIFHGPSASGQIIVWAFDLAQSNLPARLALPLLMANSLSALLAPTFPEAVLVGQSVPIDPGLTVEPPGEGLERATLLAASNGPTTTDAAVFSATRTPGLYRVYDPDGDLIGGFGVHAGSALESNLASQLGADIPALGQAATAPEIDSEWEQRELWPWLAAVVLTLILVEGWLAWR